jgi:hypothetical protein
MPAELAGKVARLMGLFAPNRHFSSTGALIWRIFH